MLSVAAEGGISLSTDPPKGRSVDHVNLAGRVKVADASLPMVVAEAVAIHADAKSAGEAKVATALHVGGLNALSTPGFLSALERSSLVYADGVAVVALAKLSGATKVQRAATTDIGVPILNEISVSLARRVRVALIGGPPELAVGAGVTLELLAQSEVVYATDGYKNDDAAWAEVLADVNAANPDVILLGLGSPRELLFADAHLRALPPALVLTCGGWFGFLIGEEPRAHPLLQKLGLEWIRRLLHNPSRLAGRYARGALVTARFAFGIVLEKVRSA